MNVNVYILNIYAQTVFRSMHAYAYCVFEVGTL